MKKFLIPALVGIGVLAVAAKAPKDPVLLTVDGEPVTLSEFEYFYHKNDGNEVEHETPEQYLQRFIDYKLKVAQAKAERQDTTASFRKDFRDYRRELAEPYMSDTKVYDQLVENAYKHTLKEVQIDHLMLPLDRPDLADSLQRVLAAGQADFYEMVKQFSIDPSAKQNGGKYDWIHAGEFPYEFEEIAFETPLNEISPVAKTNYGYHIVRPTAERPNIGEVHGAHILVKLDRGRRLRSRQGPHRLHLRTPRTGRVVRDSGQDPQRLPLEEKQRRPRVFQPRPHGSRIRRSHFRP